MPQYAPRHPALVVGVVAAMGTATVAPAVATATSAPAPVHRTLDLGGLLAGMLETLPGTVGGIVDQLGTGTPSGALPSTTLSALIQTLVGAPLIAVAEILALLSPAQLSQIVTEGPAAATTQLLQAVLASVTKLTSALVTGTASLPAVGDAFANLTAILEGGVPTAAGALRTLIAALDQITTQLGLPNVASLPAVGPLVERLLAISGQVTDPAASAAITRTLAAAARAAALDPAALAALSSAGLAGAPASAAARVARARITSFTVRRDRRGVRLRVVCPTTAPAAGCAVRPSVTLAGKAAKLGRSVTIPRGATRTISAAVPASVAREVRRSGGRLVVRVATTGATAGAAKRIVTVPAG